MRALTLMLASVLALMAAVSASAEDGTKPRADKNDEPPARTDRFGAPLPRDALVRLGVARFRVEGGVTSIAFSPDGKLLAGGDTDGSVYLWEAATGKVIHQLDAGERGATVIFSPDGKSVWTRCWSGEVRHWEVASGKLHVSFQRRANECHNVEQLLPAPDGARLIVVGDSNWQIQVRNGIHADSYVMGHELPELSIDLLEASSGKVVKQLAKNDPETVFSDAALSPDGKLLAVAIRAYKAPRKLLRLIDSANGEVVREIKGEGEGWYLSVAFSHDGKTLALGSKDEITLVDVSTGKLVDRLKDKMSTVAFVGFSPDGKTLISRSHDRKVRVWDLAAKKVVRRSDANAGEIEGYEEGHRLSLLPNRQGDAGEYDEVFYKSNTTALSPDGKTVAVGMACPRR